MQIFLYCCNLSINTCLEGLAIAYIEIQIFFLKFVETDQGFLCGSKACLLYFIYLRSAIWMRYTRIPILKYWYNVEDLYYSQKVSES